MARSFPEKLILDTSVLGRVTWRGPRIAFDARWERVHATRIEAASLAISIVTLAEVRFGYRAAGWGPHRVSVAETRLASLVSVPVDDPDIDEWSRLAAAARAKGVALSDNDLWIAAAASARGRALITCDRDHERIASEMPVEVVFLAPPV